MSDLLAANLTACRSCPRRQPPPYAGLAACLETGRDYHDHARAGDCPLGRFPKSATQRGPLPVGEGMLEGYAASPGNAVEGGCGCSPPVQSE